MNGENNTASEQSPEQHPKPSAFVRIWHALWRRRHWRKIGNRPHVNWAEKLTVVITLAILIVGVIQARIYWRQTQLMKASLNQNERSIILNMGQLGIANRNAKTAEDSLAKSQLNFEKTSQSGEKTFRDEQRAWIGVQDAITKDFTEANSWEVTVIFFNSGRTPARNVQISSMYETSPIPIPGPNPKEIKRLTFHPAQSVAPQSKYFHRIGGQAVVGEPYKPSQVQGIHELVSEYQYIKSKALVLYYFGILKYDDIFGNPRTTKFCIYLANPDTKEIGFCDASNDLN